jgi:hypothetical protein
MNNITNGQPAIMLDFNSTIFTKLKDLSFERNSLCGPFPKSWKENGVNVNLKDHSKTLWCSPSLNNFACDLFSLTNSYFIVNDQNQTVQLLFNTSCDVDYSKIQCGNSENVNSFINVGSSNKLITCESNSIRNVKSDIFLVWPDSNTAISQNTTVYRIYSQYISYLEGTSSALLGQNVSVKIKMEKSISKDIHNHLFCSFASGNETSLVTTLNNRDDEVSCIVRAIREISISSISRVNLRYSFSNQTFDISKSWIFVVIFGKEIYFKFLKNPNQLIQHPIWDMLERKKKFQSIMILIQFLDLIDMKLSFH